MDFNVHSQQQQQQQRAPARTTKSQPQETGKIARKMHYPLNGSSSSSNNNNNCHQSHNNNCAGRDSASNNNNSAAQMPPRRRQGNYHAPPLSSPSSASLLLLLMLSGILWLSVAAAGEGAARGHGGSATSVRGRSEDSPTGATADSIALRRLKRDNNAQYSQQHQQQHQHELNEQPPSRQQQPKRRRLARKNNAALQLDAALQQQQQQHQQQQHQLRRQQRQQRQMQNQKQQQQQQEQQLQAASYNSLPRNTFITIDNGREFSYQDDTDEEEEEEEGDGDGETAAAAKNGAQRRANGDDNDDEDDDISYSDSAGAAAAESLLIGKQSTPDLFTCCNEVFGACRSTCENLSLVQLAATGDALEADRQFRFELRKFCPSMQLSFWNCVNRTLAAVAHGTDWSGRRCCHLGLAPRCRNACMMADASNAAEALNRACRQSDEQHMFACFEEQEQLRLAGDRCCGNARTTECLQACRDIFEPSAHHDNNNNKRTNNNNINRNNLNRRGRQRLRDLCGDSNAEMLQCVGNWTDLTPLMNAQKYRPCCDYSPLETCRSTCHTLLNSSSESLDVVIGEMETAGCGKPLPHLPLWQCFLTAEKKLYVPATTAGTAPHLGSSFSEGGGPSSDVEVSQINRIGMDAAKLHCCARGHTARCRRLCALTFTTEWSAKSAQFESACLAQPGELSLRQCMDEVEEPCTLGCDGLAFCTNFNNRPTELFRSCSAAADEAARADLLMWQQRGHVTLPGGLALPIRNVTRCRAERWKAVVCALQLKPCTRLGHYTHICHEDCYDVLSECTDWTRMTADLSPDAICAHLHPDGAAGANGGGGGGEVEGGESIPCVSLRPFLEESDAPKDTGGHHGLTAACRASPCSDGEGGGEGEVCVPLRNESHAHECLPGCALGEASNYAVPFGAHVRIPVVGQGALATTSSHGGSASTSFKVCRCSVDGRIEHCQPLPSVSHDNCLLPGGRNIRHGSSFYLECNLCGCYAEEVTCTKKQCRLPGYTDSAFTSLPCNCRAHYVPMCGRNGNTYPSACVAKCLGVPDGDLEYGACSARAPCAEGAHACAPATRCVEQRKVCLSALHRPCAQYVCVNQTRHCEDTHRPVCDTSGRTHRSACELLNAGAELAHWGACYGSCSWRGPVCGINGVTYPHECAAWGDHVLADHPGRCREVGLLAHDMGRRCRTVQCPAAPSPHCRRIVPPGACCAVCGGGAFRVIYSRKQIDRALYALRGQSGELLTLQSVLSELDALVQLSECQLSGFLSMEVGLFVAVTPRVSAALAAPTPIQIEACTREAERISGLIETQSHQITTNLVLSGLTVSHMVQPTTESAAAGGRGNYSAFLWVLSLGLGLGFKSRQFL